jgi:aryl-alcohol dehydrogenase-like predicted oxidoreductase
MANRRGRERNGARFVVAQNAYNLLHREVEAEVAPACLEYGVGLVAYHPLAQGLLTGKYKRDQPPPAGTRLAGGRVRPDARVFDRLDAVQQYAQSRGVSLLQVALGGLLAHPAVASLVIGATHPDQVRANAAAAAWEPTADDLETLKSLLTSE